ncbi:MAG: excinuclease ABC subunit UvrC [Syntrophobacterales bacterium]|nr:MAG: excinuclease ABC subunit UvrC [Syntrophobacterales bacterium]
MDEKLRQEKIRNAPARSGVYLMKDGDGRVIYVGKAKNLRARVRSYFGGTDLRRMIPFLVSRIQDMEFIVTDTEKEALILENNLIKKHRPRYNVNLRDDKNFYSLRVDTTQYFPRFQLVRSIKKDGARYFGPYSSSASMKETFWYLHRIFPRRTCRDLEFKTRNRPCMEFQIKRCLAPCCGLVTAADYRRLVADATLFLEGRSGKLVRQLRSRMDRSSEEMRFEEAARIRDKIGAIETTLEKQRIVSSLFKDQDLFGSHRVDDRLQIYAIHVRKGAIIGQRSFPLVKTRLETSEALSSLLKQYYNAGVTVPREVIVPERIEDAEVIEQWLTEKKGGKVSLLVPRRGNTKALLAMALSNAENALRASEKHENEHDGTLAEIESLLLLKKVPRRIECFDISNIGGNYAVGSMVVFTEGVPDKSRYRRFKIRTKEEADDYGMMREVLERRYGEGSDLPDLIMVDGGKGQLGVALSVLEERGVQGVDVIGLAKEAHTFSTVAPSAVSRDRDRVYLPNRKNPLYLDKHPRALFLLQRVRDEAHRFAVTYHRTLKAQKDFSSVLDNVPGIGAVRKKALLTFFRDVKKIEAASREELEKVPGIGENAAHTIFEYFHAPEKGLDL